MTPAPTPTPTLSKLVDECERICQNALGHVGAANYRERQEEAEQWMDAAFANLYDALRARPGVGAPRYRFECDGQRWVDEYAASHCPVCKKPVVGDPIPAPPAQGADTLSKIASDLMANQQHLPPDMERILHERRDELYIDPPAQGADAWRTPSDRGDGSYIYTEDKFIALSWWGDSRKVEHLALLNLIGPPANSAKCSECNGTGFITIDDGDGKPTMDVCQACPPAQPAEPSEDNYIGWARDIPGEPDGEGTALELCDSDTPGAYKIWRRP